MPLRESWHALVNREGAWRAARRVVKRQQLRRLVDDAWDSARLWMDTMTDPTYQPRPGQVVARDGASRAAGTLTRWESMLPVLRETRAESALDIGCNAGWFALQLASLGIPTVGVESHGPYYRTAIYYARHRQAKDFGVLVLTVDPENVRLLPHVDCTLLLSVWHHFVLEHGVDGATGLLAAIWERTERVLFFETGEMEMGTEYGLPKMEPEPRAWLAAYLMETCPGAVVRHLGAHHGGPPATSGAPVHYRNLFAVVRASSVPRCEPESAAGSAPRGEDA